MKIDNRTVNGRITIEQEDTIRTCRGGWSSYQNRHDRLWPGAVHDHVVRNER